LKILSPYVDTFVLVECPQTFSGKRKALSYHENKSKFAMWSHQIHHHIVADPIESMEDVRSRLESEKLPADDRWILNEVLNSTLAKGDFHWKQEFFQKESIRKAIPSLDTDSVMFFGDVDEIWNPVMDFNWNQSLLFRLHQAVHPYWMNNRSNEVWTSAVFTSTQNLQGRFLNELRMNSAGLVVEIVPNGGWHFSYQGGPDRIKTKLESFGHQEFNTPKIKKRIATRLAKQRDILGRRFEFEKSEEGLPPEVLAMKQKLPGWFL